MFTIKRTRPYLQQNPFPSEDPLFRHQRILGWKGHFRWCILVRAVVFYVQRTVHYKSICYKNESQVVWLTSRHNSQWAFEAVKATKKSNTTYLGKADLASAGIEKGTPPHPGCVLWYPCLLHTNPQPSILRAMLWFYVLKK